MSALRLCSFESRRGDEMRSLIERHGGIATIAPSMREVPLESNTHLLDFAVALQQGRFDMVVFLTGVGARTLMHAIDAQGGRESFLAALRRTTVAVRGPKPIAVLREWEVPFAIRAPEPNTWRELVTALVDFGDLTGKRIAVQEYGRPNQDFYRELRSHGALVEPIPVYRWALPDDTEPLRKAIRATIDGQFDVLLFTSAHQLESVLEVAASLQLKEAWVDAARACAIASIGPTASETIREHELPVDIEASPTRMGQLVRDAISGAPAILATKRG